MQVIPAIDLRGGKCVRLYQGDYARETVYSDDPVETALRWVDMGARRLHIVDLDGARDGVPANLDAAGRIAAAAGVPAHFGGGIRGADAAQAAMDAGMDRIMLGTAAVEDADLVRALLGRFGAERVVVSVDAKDGQVALRGWTRSSGKPAAELVADMARLGVKRVLYTDISRDGTLTEPNFEGVAALARQGGVGVIAAGGVSQVSHIERLAAAGAEAAIVGRAIYTGDMDLRQAIAAADAVGGGGGNGVDAVGGGNDGGGAADVGNAANNAGDAIGGGNDNGGVAGGGSV